LSEERETDAADEDRRVIELLRTPGLSIKHLDEQTKERVRRFIQRTHIEKGVSLVDIAKMIGNKTSGYTSWLTRQLGGQPRPFEEARLKAIKEKRRKYERKPFDGTRADRAYLLGLRHGDISAFVPFTDAIRVSTSTTHPAMVELFASLFGPYGHIYRHPRYKKDTCSYEWNIHAILDESFDFLLEDREMSWKWMSENEDTKLRYLAGMLDADGSVTITGNRDGTGGTILMVCFYNTNLDLLHYIIKLLQSLGYNPIGPYLDKPRGYKSSKYGIPHNKDYWHVALSRFSECQDLLGRLPIQHPEKIQRSQLALLIEYKEAWLAVREGVYRIRAAILEARDQFVREAETVYKKTHAQMET
jgi:hypothetical protein